MNEYQPSITMNISMLAPGKYAPEVDVDSLLRGRKFGTRQENKPFDMCPPIPSYDQQDMMELEEYCKKRGIVGINFAGMSPNQILNMLRGKVEGKCAPTTKRGILHG